MKTRGVKADPCETCKSTNDGSFDKCILLADCFGNTCAASIFTDEPAEIMDLTGDSAEQEP